MSNISKTLLNAAGYDPCFLGQENAVGLPLLLPALRRAVAPVERDEEAAMLNYVHYSVVQHRERRFPIYTAANVDGNLFVELPRKGLFPGGRDRWRTDPRIARDHQWGYELYRAKKSNFDRGHMTKREDVQWGPTEQLAKTGARLTFYYTNSVPQHPKLNRRLWLELEDYILHAESVALDLRINLFTGPALRESDPFFVTEVDSEQVQIPAYFWKVIYYPRANGALYRVGFLMGQEEVLNREGVTVPAPVDRGGPSLPEDIYFMDFDKADTYQVPVALIEELTGMRFHPAHEVLPPDRKPVELRLEEVNVRGLEAPMTIVNGLML